MSTALTILLLLVFPDGRFLGLRWRRYARVLLAGSAILAVAVAFAPGPVDPSNGFHTDNPLGIGGLAGDVAATVASVGFLPLVVQFVVALAALVLRYRRSGSVERAQLKWLVSSLGLASVLILIQFLLFAVYGSAPDDLPLWARVFSQVTILSVSFIPVAAAIAILRHRLYDIDVLIRRTLIYGVTSLALAGTFFAGVLAVQAILSPFTRGNELAVATSTLLSLALFQPLRRRVQRTVDRRFYRSKYDAERTLDAFAARLREQIDLVALERELVDAVQHHAAGACVSVAAGPP